MRYVSQEEFSPGMVVGQQIYIIRSGRALLQGGVGLKLTDTIISSLKRSKVEKLLIEDKDFSGSVTPESPIASAMESDLRVKIGEILENVSKKNNARPSEDFFKLIDRVVNEVSPTSIAPIMRYYDEENFLLEHSVNVGLMSISLGKRCGIMGAKLRELALGAFFHDIGLTQLEPSMYFLGFREHSEEDEKAYREHTVIGWKLLKEALKLKNLVPYIALRHHELMDYSGYPGGENLSSELHQVAKIVGIVDSYDMASSQKAGVECQDRFDFVLKVLGNGSKYDRSTFKNFCSTVVIYPTCSCIKLNNGQEGVVTGQNGNRLKPIVLVADENNEKQVLDLLKPENADLKIVDCNC